MARFVPRDQGHRLACAALHLHVEGTLELRRLALVTATQPAIEFRVARLPNLVTPVNPGKVDVPPPERQHRLTFTTSARQSDFVNPSPLLFLLRMPGVEHHPIPWFKRCDQLEPNLVA